MKWVWSEFTWEYSRSSGPGGQHVNRTNSAVMLRFNVRETSILSDIEKERVLAKLSHRLTSENEIIIKSQEFRDQDANKKQCLKKLEQILKTALFVPKKRVPTKPTRSSQKKRVESKTLRGSIKKNRQKPSYDD